MLRGAHERKKTKLTIINLLFVFFLLTSFLFMIFLESCHDTFLDEIIILVNNRPTLRLGIRYWMMKCKSGSWSHFSSPETFKCKIEEPERRQ